MLPEESGASPPAPAPPDRAAVQRELDRLLAHVAFRRSSRCTKLLRHLVEQTLANPDFLPKERTLAIEVFGRPPDYDTAADPIVRTTANEIRKRLGAYFHDRGADAEVVIELRSGSYRPTFRTVPPRDALPADPTVPLVPGGAAPALRLRRLFQVASIGSGLTVLLIALLILIPRLLPSNFDRFWHPFLYSGRRVLVSPPTPDYVRSPAAENTGPAPGSTPMIPMSDSKAVWRVLSVLDTRQKNIIVRTSDRLRDSDFLDGPAIVIGDAQDPWSVRTLSRLRFHIVAHESAHTLQIVDQQAPTSQGWTVDTQAAAGPGTRLYAVLTRVIDPNTENAVLSITGVGMYATAAGAEFVAEPRHLNALRQRLNGCDRNLQLVLSAAFANNNMSDPRVEAIHCW